MRPLRKERSDSPEQGGQAIDRWIYWSEDSSCGKAVASNATARMLVCCERKQASEMRHRVSIPLWIEMYAFVRIVSNHCIALLKEMTQVN